MKTRNKLKIAICSLSAMVLVAIASFITVFSALTTTAQNSFKVTYTAIGVKATVTTTYKKETTKDATDDVKYVAANDKTSNENSVSFTGSETGTAATKTTTIADATITKDEAYVMKYAIKNDGTVEMSVKVAFTAASGVKNNTTYYANASDNSDPAKVLLRSTTSTTDITTTGLSTTIPTIANVAAGATTYVYIVCVITDTNLDSVLGGTIEFTFSTNL